MNGVFVQQNRNCNRGIYVLLLIKQWQVSLVVGWRAFLYNCYR